MSKKGYKFTDTHKQKLSLSKLGDKNPNYNKPTWNKGKQNIYSESTKWKMGATNRGKPSIYKGMVGRYSIESINKMKSKAKGKYSGNKNPRWKGGKQIRDGYVYVYFPTHPNAYRNFIPEHHLIIEKHIGRILKKGEIVHHIDFNKSNNNPNNLFITTKSKHMQLHSSFGKMIEKLIKHNIIYFDKTKGRYIYEQFKKD